MKTDADRKPGRKAGPNMKPMNHKTQSVEERREIGLYICSRIANGEYLSHVCKEAGMPDPPLFWKWRNEDAVLFNAYTAAQNARAERLADQIVEVADEAPAMVKDGDGALRIDPGAVAHQRLKVDARKWVASKLLPKRYGERLEVAGTLTHNIIPPDVVLDKVRTMSPLLAAKIKRGSN